MPHPARPILLVVLAAALPLACGGGKDGTTTPPPGGGGGGGGEATTTAGADADAESQFGPLEVGADWQSYKKLSKEPWVSKTHGNRFVETYVNDVGYEAYISDKPFPVGTVIVKTSWENEGGQRTETPGPIFVMRKEEPGYLPDHADWYYAIHWEKPTPDQAAKIGGPFYWRGKSPKVKYCYGCHDNYDRSVGGIPKEQQAW